MELVIAVLGLVVFAVLAVRYGHDSRDQLMTKDRDLAARGVTWDDLQADTATRRDRSIETRTEPTAVPLRDGTRAGTRPART